MNNEQKLILQLMDGFRNNPVKGNRIKQALYKILKDVEMVERSFEIVVKQEEY